MLIINIYDLRGHHTRSVVFVLQNMYKSLNFGFRVKIPIIKLNCDHISIRSSLCFFSIKPNITFIIPFKINKNFNFFKCL